MNQNSFVFMRRFKSLLLALTLFTTALVSEQVTPLVTYKPALLQPQSDYELTHALVEQTQAALGDFELLADEYENFQELEERFACDRDNRDLAQALVVCARRLKEVITKRHLKESFSAGFIQQVDTFAALALAEGGRP